MSLSFLRPMALPRPSTLKHFLGLARASTTATSPAGPASSIPPLAKPAASKSKPTPSNPATVPAVPKPYRVTRTGTNGLPVYLLSKRGGNLKQTKLRRIEGNINVLRTDLQKALGLEEKDVMINQLTQQIIVKGHKKFEVLKFLEDHKF